MTRKNLTSAMSAALSAKRVRCALLASMQMAVIPSYTLHLWSGIGDLELNGITYLGNGWLRPLSQLSETGDITASGIEVNLTGVGSDIMALALGATTHILMGEFHLAALDDNGAVISDPVMIFRGHLDTVYIDDSTDQSVLTITYESELIRMSNNNPWQYTHEDQQALFPGDQGFRYVAKLSQQKFFWGRREKKKGKGDRRRNQSSPGRQT